MRTVEEIKNTVFEYIQIKDIIITSCENYRLHTYLQKKFFVFQKIREKFT